MTRKHTKRKVWPLRDPISYAMSGARSFDSVGHKALVVRATNHGAMRALITGNATKDDMVVLTNVLNMAVALGKQGFGAPHGPDFQAASDAIKAISVRAVEKKRIVATGPEIQALNFLLEIHDAQLGVVSVSEIDRANRYVNACIQSGASEGLSLGAIA